MAGANMKGIRQRIKSVKSTMQITKAMELVASSKLRKAKERAERARPYFDELSRLMSQIGDGGNGSVYRQERGGNCALFVVIAGDRGLAGGYNSGAFRLAQEAMSGKEALIAAIGKKAEERYAKEGERLVYTIPEIGQIVSPSQLEELTGLILEQYQSGQADEVYVVYTRFVSSLSQKPVLQKLFPLPKAEEKSAGPGELMIYDPSPEAVFNRIIPEYVTGILFGAVCESYASEQGARRTAMESANDNAQEMIESLSLHYNRARQAAITQEITEIVAGANASQE